MPSHTSKPTTAPALAQQFLAANPKTIDIANDRTDWPGTRRPLRAARALLQLADTSQALRDAAAEYIKAHTGRGYRREGFRARFAAQLCAAAGAPFCKRCGRYLTDHPHTPCPFGAFQAALLGLPNPLPNPLPNYLGLDRAVRLALQDMCVPIARSPRIDTDLSGVAASLSWYLETDINSPYKSYQRRVFAHALAEIIERLRTCATAAESATAAALNLVEEAA